MRELARGGDLGRHVRELEPDRLEVGDPAAELLALERVVARRVERRLRDTDCLGRDPDAPAVEGRHRDDEPLPLLVQEPVAVHDDAVETEVRGRRRVEPELLLLAGHLDVIGVEQERGYAARALGSGIRPGEDEERRRVAAVRAPLLRSVDPPAAAVAVPHGRRPQRSGVRPRPRLGERERPDRPHRARGAARTAPSARRCRTSRSAGSPRSCARQPSPPRPRPHETAPRGRGRRTRSPHPLRRAPRGRRPPSGRARRASRRPPAGTGARGPSRPRAGRSRYPRTPVRATGSRAARR